MRIYELSVDTIKSSAGYRLDLVEDDYGTSTLQINLTRNGSPIDLTNATAVEIPYKRPDGRIVVQTLANGITIVNPTAGKISCLVTTNALGIPGRVFFDVRIMWYVALETSAQMRFYVRRPTMSSGDITDMDQYPLLQTLIIKCETFTDEEIARVENEEGRIAAEGLRVIAEGEREQGEANRNAAYGIAEDGRNLSYGSAEDLRNEHYNSAEDSRNDYYDIAEGSRNGSYNTSEGNRNSAYNSSEGNRNSSYTSAEGDRNIAYGSAEDERDRLYGLAEDNRDELYETAEGDRDADYGLAEDARDNLYEAAEGVRDDLFNAAEVARNFALNSHKDAELPHKMKDERTDTMVPMGFGVTGEGRPYLVVDDGNDETV